MPSGVVAAGHPLTAAAGAEVLRAGGNAVDAALASMLTSFVAEPLLTGLGAGGYMLVVPGGGDPVLLDFFVEAPGHGASGERAPLLQVDVSFGDAVQAFHIGASSCGTYGVPAGVCAAAARFGTVPLADLAAPAAALARDGVRINAQQAYLFEILSPIYTSTAEARDVLMPEGRVPRQGDVLRSPALADGLERLGEEGAEPFYEGDIGAAVSDRVCELGGWLTRADLAQYRTLPREPVHVSYRGRDVLLNPPPSAGGTLIAFALALLERTTSGPPDAVALVQAMQRAQAQRTQEFLSGLAEPGFLERFMASRLGSTTHISVIDGDGWACAVTCSNGEGSGIVVPGTGVHVNNMMGEQDLSPLGFFSHPPGRRLPSMMAPTIVLGTDGAPELALGSAGSNRIRSTLLQVIVNVIDRGMDAAEAVRAPRLHFEDGLVYAEPGIDAAGLAAEGRSLAWFRDLNLFFGGCQAVERDPATGTLDGGGDPRRGGAVVEA
ncbi:MAG TPA: gamma-glutamyltransferase [Solirubrobacteraceae bacterium]|nr:gamma-glutamyltransferase [Solirubrobacteraceae bacterium]